MSAETGEQIARHCREPARLTQLWCVVVAVVRYTAQEVGSRIFELIKRSNHMMVEYDENNIIKFVAPSCKTMLGYDTPELTNRDMMKYVHPGDRTAVQKELDNLRSGHTHHVCCVFRRLSRRGVLWVEMNAHIVQRRGFDPVVLGIEHMVPDQTAQDAKGVTSRSLVVAEAPENDKPIPDGLAVAVVGTVHEARNPIHAARAATSALRKVLRSHKEAAIVTIDQLDTLTDSLDQIRRLMQDVFVAFSGHPSAVTVYPHPYKLLHLLQRLCKQFQFLTSVHIKVEVRSVALGAPLLLLLLAMTVCSCARGVCFLVDRSDFRRCTQGNPRGQATTHAAVVQRRHERRSRVARHRWQDRCERVQEAQPAVPSLRSERQRGIATALCGQRFRAPSPVSCPHVPTRGILGWIGRRAARTARWHGPAKLQTPGDGHEWQDRPATKRQHDHAVVRAASVSQTGERRRARVLHWSCCHSQRCGGEARSYAAAASSCEA